MSRRKPRVETGPVLFDVFYKDGTRASNRKVPGEQLNGLDGDEPALTYIMDQERKIAGMSGQPPRDIERVVRSGARDR